MVNYVVSYKLFLVYYNNFLDTIYEIRYINKAIKLIT